MNPALSRRPVQPVGAALLAALAVSRDKIADRPTGRRAVNLRRGVTAVGAVLSSEVQVRTDESS
jgi:hypothetical protein